RVEAGGVPAGVAGAAAGAADGPAAGAVERAGASPAGTAPVGAAGDAGGVEPGTAGGGDAAGRGSQRRRTASSCSRATGLDRSSSMPASRQRRRSAALAVGEVGTHRRRGGP